MLALILTLILTLFSFALDYGFFLRERNRYQAAAESAAMAAVEALCTGDPEQAAQDIILGHNLDLPEGAVTVETGFYDAYDQYEAPLGDYTDFAPEDGESFPAGESVNAVLVTIGRGDKIKSLTGFNREKEIVGAGMAYLPRLSVAAGKNIEIYGSKITFSNGNFYAEDDINLGIDDPDSLSGRNVSMATGSGRSIQLFSPRGVIWYPSGTKTSAPVPESALIEAHKNNLEIVMARLKKKADRVYTLADRGSAFYAESESAHDFFCFFDFTTPKDGHKNFYIDIPKNLSNGKRTKVIISPYPCGDLPSITVPNSVCGTGGRAPFGNSITNMTIAADCDIIIPIYDNPGNGIISLGGKGTDQLTILSAGSIKFHPQNNDMEGVNFVCEENFKMDFAHSADYSPPPENGIRIISYSGDILFNQRLFSAPANMGIFNFNFNFGPPCPVILPSALGRLELAK